MPKLCRNCQFPIKFDCDHIRCRMAQAQGFCMPQCQQVYFDIKNYEKSRFEEQFERERRRMA